MFANIYHSFGDDIFHVNALFRYAFDYNLNDTWYVTVIHAQNYLIVTKNKTFSYLTNRC